FPRKKHGGRMVRRHPSCAWLEFSSDRDRAVSASSTSSCYSWYCHFGGGSAVARKNICPFITGSLTGGAALGALCRLCNGCCHVWHLPKNAVHLLSVLMPASSQVECECNRALSSTESVLVRGTHVSECLAQPKRGEASVQKQTHHSAWSRLLKIGYFFAL